MPQLLIPTSVSHQSSIVRNIPTTLIGIPLTNVLNDRERAAITTQWQIEQWIQDRLNNNNNQNRNIEDQLNREIVIQSQQRRLNNQILNEQVVADQLRTEQIRDELDRSESTRRLLQQKTDTTGLSSAQLRSAITGRFI